MSFSGGGDDDDDSWRKEDLMVSKMVKWKKGCVENGVERGWGWKGIVEDENENEEDGWLRNDIDF